MATRNRAVLQLRTILEDCVQRDLILTNKRIGARVLVPIFAEREDFRQRYGKIARLSIKLSIVFCISSSYSLDAKASRGRARIFHARLEKISLRNHTTTPLVINWPATPFYPDEIASRADVSKRLLVE